MRISASNTYDIYHMSMSHYCRFRSLKCILIPEGRVSNVYNIYASQSDYDSISRAVCSRRHFKTPKYGSRQSIFKIVNVLKHYI